MADLKTCLWIFYARDDTHEIQNSIGSRSKLEVVVSFLACSSYLGSDYLLEVCIEYLQNNADLIPELLPFVVQYDNKKADLKEFVVTHLKWRMTREIVPLVPLELFDDVFCRDMWVENNADRLQILTDAHAIKPLPWVEETIDSYKPYFRANEFEGLFTSCVKLKANEDERSKEITFNGVIWAIKIEEVQRKLFLKLNRCRDSNFPDLERARLSWTYVIKQHDKPEERFIYSDTTFNGWSFFLPEIHFEHNEEFCLVFHITKIER